MKLTKRYCKVILEKFDKNGITEDRREFENLLNVKFTYTRYIGNSMHSKGKISICGLTKDAIDTYTAFFSQDVEVAKRKTITVIAGYDDKNYGYGTIISGTVIEAIPTNPPDVWLNCTVINQYEAKLKKDNYSFKGIKTLKEVLEWASQTLNLKLDNRLKTKQGETVQEFTEYLEDIKYKDFNFEGNKFDFVNKIGSVFYARLSEKDSAGQKHGGILTYIEDDTLVADFCDLLQEDYNRNGTPILVSKDSQQCKMVGIPRPAWAGQAVSITTLLNPSIKTGQIIKLKSDLIEALNGYYYVWNITYNGEYRGTNWYSQFLCRRLK